MGLSVSAIEAFAFLTTRNTSSEALAIIFVARRFLARASSCRHIGGHPREMTWVAVVGDTLSMIYSSWVVRMVSTTRTDTLFATDSSFCKALTVKFETIDLGTLAASILIILCFHGCTVLTGRLSSRDGFSWIEVCWAYRLIVVNFNKLVKEISARRSFADAVFIDLHKLGGGQGTVFNLLKKFFEGMWVVHTLNIT